MMLENEIAEAKNEMHSLAEQMVREIEFDQLAYLEPKTFKFGSIEPRMFPYRIVGLSANAAIPMNDISSPVKIGYLYLNIIGDWYRVSMDEEFSSDLRAKVELLQFPDAQAVMLSEPIGWIRYTDTGKFNYYCQLIDREMENYEHPDIIETVMKLAVVYQAATKKTSSL